MSADNFYVFFKSKKYPGYFGMVSMADSTYHDYGKITVEDCENTLEKFFKVWKSQFTDHYFPTLKELEDSYFGDYPNPEYGEWHHDSCFQD